MSVRKATDAPTVRIAHFGIIVAAAFLCGVWRPAFAGVVVMKSGFELEGQLGVVSGIADDPRKPKKGPGGVKLTLLTLVDDGLRRTFVSKYQVRKAFESAAPVTEKISIPQRVATAGKRVTSIGQIREVDKFDEFGRRMFTMRTTDGTVHILQGITEITPVWTRVQGLVGVRSYVMDMRISTHSIPRETLQKILMKKIDRDDVDQRLAIVRLFNEAERFHDARIELEEVIRDFPQLTHLKKQVSKLRQLSAQRLIDEIKLRKEVGQHRLAIAMLQQFPKQGLAGELLGPINDSLEEYRRRVEQRKKIVRLLTDHTAALQDAAVRARVKPITAEITSDLNFNNLVRMADYLRLAEGDSLTAEQKVALAVSSWLLGSGNAIDNLPVALAIHDVRQLVRAFLRSDDLATREDLLKRIAASEGGTPDYVAKLLMNMLPPLDAPDAPAEADDPPGMRTLTVPGLSGGGDFTYHIQLPPEYDPYRKYPVIVTLRGARYSAKSMIGWWAGPYSEKMKMRLGQATRHGYIVIAPEWARRHQTDYEYTAREHAAVMFSLRDAMRRFSIDTNRVFLAGHSMGGDAAWDIGLSHPDLWAGVLPVVATADKYVKFYKDNARLVPTYFVNGELDGPRLSINSSEFDHYLKTTRYDTVVTEYQGRGHEYFHDDIQRMFKWMEIHRRSFYPEEYEAVTMRPWDNFFFWVELDRIPRHMTVVPAAWPPPDGTRACHTYVRNYGNNSLVVKSGARSATIFLSPETVDFDEQVSILFGTKRERIEPRGDVKVMLQDVRTRGDRLEPFWAKVRIDRGG